jgi:hypothetical protein
MLDAIQFVEVEFRFPVNCQPVDCYLTDHRQLSRSEYLNEAGIFFCWLARMCTTRS